MRLRVQQRKHYLFGNTHFNYVSNKCPLVQSTKMKEIEIQARNIGGISVQYYWLIELRCQSLPLHVIAQAIIYMLKKNTSYGIAIKRQK